jgi:hypothetical protein
VSTDLAEARATYVEHGWWVSPELFGADEVERFRAATARVIEGSYRGDRAPTLVLPPHPTEFDLRKIDNAWWADPRGDSYRRQELLRDRPGRAARRPRRPRLE